MKVPRMREHSQHRTDLCLQSRQSLQPHRRLQQDSPTCSLLRMQSPFIFCSTDMQHMPYADMTCHVQALCLLPVLVCCPVSSQTPSSEFPNQYFDQALFRNWHKQAAASRGKSGHWFQPSTAWMSTCSICFCYVTRTLQQWHNNHSRLMW